MTIKYPISKVREIALYMSMAVLQLKLLQNAYFTAGEMISKGWRPVVCEKVGKAGNRLLGCWKGSVVKNRITSSRRKHRRSKTPAMNLEVLTN